METQAKWAKVVLTIFWNMIDKKKVIWESREMDKQQHGQLTTDKHWGRYYENERLSPFHKILLYFMDWKYIYYFNHEWIVQNHFNSTWFYTNSKCQNFAVHLHHLVHDLDIAIRQIGYLLAYLSLRLNGNVRF